MRAAVAKAEVVGRPERERFGEPETTILLSSTGDSGSRFCTPVCDERESDGVSVRERGARVRMRQSGEARSERMQKEGGFGAVRGADGVPGSGSRSSVASSDRPCPFLFSSSLSTTLSGCLLPAGIEGVEGSSSGVASRGNSDCSGAREGGAVEEEDAAEETAPRSDAPCASSCESIAAVVRLREERECGPHARAERASERESKRKSAHAESDTATMQPGTR